MKETRLLKIAKNIDALGCSLIAKRAKVGEYISTYCWRVRKAWAVKLINRIFGDPNHCRDCYIAQLPILTDMVDVREQFDEESA